MALNYFEAERGFSIDDQAVVIFHGSNPTVDLDGVLSADVPIGSLYLNTTTGNVLTRTAIANDDETDWAVSADQDYVDSQLATQVSWREPAVVCDSTTYANTAAAEAAMNAGSPPGLDGEALADGDRVLLTDIPSTGSPSSASGNVFIVTGTPGSGATLVEDANTATSGDTVYVESGTCAGQRLTYNGTAWVLTDQSSSDELGYIRDFIGKDTTGPETPIYTNDFNVTPNNNLEGAIDELDTILGANTFTNDFHVVDSASFTANIDALDSILGDNLYTNDYVVTDSATFTANIDALDTQFGDGNITNQGGNYSLSGDMLWSAGSPTGTLDLTDAFDELNASIGDKTYTAQNYITNGESVAESLDAIDQAIANTAAPEFSGTMVDATTPVIVDTIPHGGTATQVKWLVIMKNTGDADRVESVEVHGLTNGVDQVSHTVYGRLRADKRVQGSEWEVTTDGTNIYLSLEASNDIDYKVQRVHVVSL